MIRHPQADGTAAFMLQATRRVARCLEEKGVRPRSVRTKQTILPVVDQGVLPDIREIPAHQGEVMISVCLANVADTLERRLVANMTTERVAGIRGVYDHPPSSQRFDGLTHVTSLGRDRMELQIDAHLVGYDTRMNQLLELSPLILFLIVFEILGIYWATAALMIACVLVMAIHRVRTGKFKLMHVITTAVVVTLGAATLLLHDVRFIHWKPTVLLGLTAAAFLGSMAIGKQPLVRRMLEGVFEEPLEVSSRTWLLINALWAAWFAALAVANIYVANNFAESTWVHFKVYGITPATMLFMIPQVLWLSGKTGAPPLQTKPPTS
jgi:intracellular septation protein